MVASKSPLVLEAAIFSKKLNCLNLFAMTEMELKLLFDKYNKRLIFFCHKYVKDIHVAEEIVSDAFMSYYTSKNNSLIDPYPYLQVVVKNKSLNYIRDNSGIEIINESVVDHFTHSTSIIKFEILELIEKKILELPTKRRDLFKLYSIGYNYPEISQITKTNERSVVDNIKKAKDWLQKQLKGVLVINDRFNERFCKRGHLKSIYTYTRSSGESYCTKCKNFAQRENNSQLKYVESI